MLVVFGDEALVRAALEFETALAQAQAAEGLISGPDAEAIAAACGSLQIDITALAKEAAHGGTLAIPLVQQIRGRVGTSAEKAVHLGATSQDLADTALVLQIKAAGTLLEDTLQSMTASLAALAENHASTPMLGRTLLQGALPITFGLKAANWLLAIDEARARFAEEQRRALVVQFGGATGSLAGLDGKALAVADRLSSALGLGCPPMPWHSRRNAIAGLASALAIVTGATGKIARDISLLAQTEVAEAFEPKTAGRGGSSSMAHKRNPTGCQIALSAALRTPGLAATIYSALPQEHERGLGGWQAEAPVLAELYELTQGAVTAMAAVIPGLKINPDKMLENLKAAGVGLDIGESSTLVRRAIAHCRTRTCL
jgi:3-carboxy-cis,cis-muconate cycloisomerase